MKLLRRAALVLPVLAATVLAAPGVTPASAAQYAPMEMRSRLGSFECTGYAGLDNHNILGKDADIVAFVMGDHFKAPGLPARKVGNGSGNITWRQPSLGVSGQTWLDSLKWLGALLDNTTDNDSAEVWPHGRTYSDAEMQQHYARAVTVTKDWIKDNPRWEQTDPRGSGQAPVASAGHRLQFLLCLREATGDQAWLDQAIARHVKFFIGKSTSSSADGQTYSLPSWKPPAPWPVWKGTNNIGLDQSLGVLGAACALGRQDWYDVAIRRIGKHANVVYDSQGVDNEEAPAYSSYNFSLWSKTLERLQECGGSKENKVAERLSKAIEFITDAHNPSGMLEELGDTHGGDQGIIYGTTAEYAATQGTVGPVPAQRVGVFDGANGGYVFGRSGWGTDRPFAKESFYSLRFGNPRLLHGHDDHTSVTYWARGKQILTEGGHGGYTKSAYRDYLLSPAAHNVVTATAPFDWQHGATKLVSAAPTAAGDAYVVKDTQYAGVTRQRSVLAVVAPQPDVMLVADTLTSKARHRYDQLWHLGTDFVAGVTGGTVSATSGDTTATVVPVVLPGKAAPSVEVERGQTSPYQGWTSPALYQRVPVSTAVVSTTASSTILLTAVIPSAAGSAVSASAVASPAGGWDVTVATGAGNVTAHLSASGILSR
ncbi:heparinase II/III-like protein [Motilibacter rhizosphaerae]|uniref:Heparinase II/III-like protein n=1 Tax=Motilibacter rhizosphaerae TaxID=598652 RepID=A0A4Q7NSS1_9ACTN|nr:heparinase II/III family protein [Motilibacter rhizosphaerae]RZS90196.1 heparinase II/III-like protein [Motilibacter rhizosphaerae]